MAKTRQIPPASFEEALQELERILQEIEAGEVSLEQSVIKYERGQFLLQYCRGILGRAEKQIEALSKPADDQSPTSEEAPSASSDQEQPG